MTAPGGLVEPPSVTYMQATKHITWLRTKHEVDIPAFFIDRKAKVTVLFSHGNAEDLGMIYEWFCEFSKELNVNLLAYDYEGYGKASGTPSEQACYDDIDAAYDFLVSTAHIPSENIVLYGRSLGSGPSCYLAERLQKHNIRLGGLILQSPLLSVFRVAFNFRFTFCGDMFPNIDRIKNVECPIFVVHGTRDEVVPFWNGENLFFAAQVKWRAKPYWIDGGGHNNIESSSREDPTFFDRFREFLTECVPTYRGTRTQSGIPGGGAMNSNRNSIRDMDYNSYAVRDSNQHRQYQHQQQHNKSYQSVR